VLLSVPGDGFSIIAVPVSFFAFLAGNVHIKEIIRDGTSVPPLI